MAGAAGPANGAVSARRGGRPSPLATAALCGAALCGSAAGGAAAATATATGAEGACRGTDDVAVPLGTLFAIVSLAFVAGAVLASVTFVSFFRRRIWPDGSGLPCLGGADAAHAGGGSKLTRSQRAALAGDQREAPLLARPLSPTSERTGDSVSLSSVPA